MDLFKLVLKKLRKKATRQKRESAKKQERRLLLTRRKSWLEKKKTLYQETDSGNKRKLELFPRVRNGGNNVDYYDYWEEVWAEMEEIAARHYSEEKEISDPDDPYDL
jgi:hypothetical protein